MARDERCVEALPLLERSFALEPSPNSLLLVARCLRDLDRREEAWLRYGGTIEIAEWRIASGEFRYQATRDVANLEQRELGEQLATLSLHVTGADANTTLSVGPLRTPLPARGLAELRLRPGTYSLTVTRGDGTQIEKSVDLDRTQPLDLALTFPAPQAAPAAKPTRDGAFAPAPAQGRRNRALVPIGIAGLGVGALGVATFVFFKLRSESAYSDLQNCYGHCPESERSLGDRGARDQTIAYVSLAVGVVGAGLGTGLLLYSRSAASRTTALEVGPSSVRLKIQFE